MPDGYPASNWIGAAVGRTDGGLLAAVRLLSGLKRQRRRILLGRH